MASPFPAGTGPASPLYQRVKSHILDRIGAGEWRAEDRLPSEHELVQALGVSRMTVHRALRELTSAGVLVRIQGVGTFVAPPHAQSPLLEVQDIAREIGARGHRHSATVLTLRETVPDAALAELFEGKVTDRAFHSLIVHCEDGVAVQVEERFVNPVLAPDYLAQDFSRITPYEYLLAASPITEIEHVITAVAADASMAGHLQVGEGAPCLSMRRRTWSGTVVATVNWLTYPGGRYALSGRNRPGEGR